MIRDREDYIYTYNEIVAKVRNRLIHYFRNLADVLITERHLEEQSSLISHVTGRVEGLREVFKRIGVVDGGSNVLSLNVGYIGVLSSIGIVIEDNQVVERIVLDPVVVPKDPIEIFEYESSEVIHSIVDKTREALVFETAVRVLDKNVDLLIIDGPLIPYGALAKRITGTPSEETAWRRYRSAIIGLHRASNKIKASVIGFVKRPRSRYIARQAGLRSFDHVILSRVLNPGEYYPEPPFELYKSIALFHDLEVVEIVAEIKPKTTYLRLSSTTPPYRIDFGHLAHSPQDILSYLYNTKTRDGVPYTIIKADEEAKITRKLIKELYEDVLHEYIVSYVKTTPDLLVPLLPEYGEL